jgi:hypothetical protein
VQAVVPLDKRTVKVYFDRAVTDSKIDGVLWSSSAGTVEKFFTLKKNTSPIGSDLIAGATLAAYKDSNDPNALFVVSTASGSAGEIFATGSGYTTFTFALSAATDADTSVAYTSEARFDTSISSLEVAASATDYAAPKVDGVMGVDAHTVQVYFNKPVATLIVGDVNVTVSSSGTGLTEGTPIAVAGTNNMQWLIPITEAMSAVSYKATFSIAGVTDKYVTAVTLDDEDTTQVATTLVKEFAGNSTTADYITSIYAVMTDNRTIEVYYPEAMQYATAVGDIDNVAATASTAHNNVDNAGNYLLKTTAGAALPGVTPAINYVAYDSATNKATLYLSSDIDSTVSSYGLVINTYIKNLTGFKTVESTSSTTNTALTVEVAKNTSTTNKGPAVTSVAISGDRMKMTIGFDSVIAVNNANPTVDTDAALDSSAKLANKATSSSTATITRADLVKVLKIAANYADAPSTQVVLAAGNVNNYIASDASVKLLSGGKSIEITFSKAIAATTDGYVSTLTSDSGSYRLYNYAFVTRTVADNETKVSFAAPGTGAFDYVAPTVLSASSLDLNGDGNVETIKVMYSEEVNDSSITAAAFNSYTISGLQTSAILTAAGITDVANDNIEYLAVTGLSGTATIANLTTNAVGAVKDLAGNSLATGLNQAVADAAAPVLLSAATVSANTIDLTYSETAAITTPATGRFTLDLDGAGAGAAVTENAVPSIAAGKVRLTFTGAFTGSTPDTDAQIAYTPNTAGDAANVKDATGNESVAKTLTGFTSGF